MRLIDADALYEKTAEWEARALAVVEKLNEKPFEEMDANEITEWRKWSCILGERSAFKHDVADAPTIEPERKKGEWINYDKKYMLATCSKCNKITMLELWGTEVKFYDYCPNCGASMQDDFSEHMNPPTT